ncbi:alpha/beta fold hydrolase [Pseudomonas syringae]|uniref:alpha/beta fold hydrolase n=1 Tax=Pseudomonas syringae TaxID=317 RepID=UPI001F10D19A|nr:alpha/beta fold hydrolase [Pseudomonas syringae]MCH5487745.1 alpha/beta fold hydrolase [Pseudomonas syringae pv. syringae]MDO1458888.1 alpha/beta fold hydrolase [Pseudomonas syringae pv. syringae]
MSLIKDSQWLNQFADELNSDADWTTAARYFDGRIQFKHDSGFSTLAVLSGKVVAVFPDGSPLGADIVVAGPDDEWQRVLDGKIDWFESLSPGLGKLELEGNVVAAWQYVDVMARAFDAMKRVGKAKGESSASWSPGPKPSGKETTGHYITVDGIRVYYEEAGQGHPIVCFHAASQDSLMYRHVLDGLSDEFRVIAIDAPGHSKSELPVSGPFQSLTRHAEFNEHLMQALGLERPAIIGCSMGGNLVLELGARKPDAYSAIISAEGADYTPTVSDFFLDMLLMNGTEIIGAWSRSMTGHRTPPDRAQEVVWQISRTTPQVMRGDLTGYANFDQRSQVGKIKAPVMLLRGDADWLVYQEKVEETASRIPGSKIAVLAGTGHYPMTENPLEFCETVRSFLHEAGLGNVG